MANFPIFNHTHTDSDNGSEKCFFDDAENPIGKIYLTDEMAQISNIDPDKPVPICQQCLSTYEIASAIDFDKGYETSEENVPIFEAVFKKYKFSENDESYETKEVSEREEKIIIISTLIPSFMNKKMLTETIKRRFPNLKQSDVNSLIKDLEKSEKIEMIKVDKTLLKKIKNYSNIFNEKELIKDINENSTIFINKEFLKLLKENKEFKNFISLNDQMEKYVELKNIHKPKPIIFDCKDFPNLEGIFKYREQLYDYFRSKKIFVSKKIVNKILLTIERDTPIIFFSRPALGKSSIAKTFLDWITTDEYYYDEDLGKQIMGYNHYLNEHITLFHRVNNFGFSWESMNVGAATSPLNVFGGLAPESIGNPKGIEAREENTEMGIISKCIFHKKYLYLDEFNRTEPENFDKLMGALQSPYFYEVPEANWRFVLKDPSKGLNRSNFIFIATMNTGDVGNYQLPFAFKRRFKIIEIEYTIDEFIQIFNFVQSKTTSIEECYTTEEKAELSKLLGENFDSVYENLNYIFADIISNICKTTEHWVEEQYVPFAVGVGHIFNFFEDISLYLVVFFLEQIGKKSIQEIQDEHKNTSVTIFFNKIIQGIVKEVFFEHIFNSLLNESDEYARNQVMPSVKDLISKITALFSQIIALLISINTENDKKLRNTIFGELFPKIFKFDKAVSRIYKSIS